MKIDIITLFPSFFDGFLETSIIKKAIKKEIVNINIIDLKKYSLRKDGRVDDRPFGGGAGMIIKAPVLYNAIIDLKKKNSYVLLLSAGGEKYDQKKALSFSKKKHLIIICGHYEGVDERILKYIDEEISIGDYVLTGGEPASLVLTDSIVRLIKGVISNDSKKEESFNENLLEYPQYTKPRDFKGEMVPEVLLSGNHQKIKEWKKQSSIKKTKKNRKDLLEDMKK